LRGTLGTAKMPNKDFGGAGWGADGFEKVRGARKRISPSIEGGTRTQIENRRKERP